jgi:hypothetical protein
VGSMLVMEGVVSQLFSPIVTYDVCYGLTSHLSKACSYRSELNLYNEIIQTFPILITFKEIGKANITIVLNPRRLLEWAVLYLFHEYLRHMGAAAIADPKNSSTV